MGAAKSKRTTVYPYLHWAGQIKTNGFDSQKKKIQGTAEGNYVAARMEKQ